MQRGMAPGCTAAQFPVAPRATSALAAQPPRPRTSPAHGRTGAATPLPRGTAVDTRASTPQHHRAGALHLHSAKRCVRSVATASLSSGAGPAVRLMRVTLPRCACLALRLRCALPDAESPPQLQRSSLRADAFRHPLDAQNTALLQLLPGLPALTKTLLGACGPLHSLMSSLVFARFRSFSPNSLCTRLRVPRQRPWRRRRCSWSTWAARCWSAPPSCRGCTACC
jgi:hypothetical protein